MTGINKQMGLDYILSIYIYSMNLFLTPPQDYLIAEDFSQ